MASCISCARGFHDECKSCKKGKCHKENKQTTEEKVLRGVGRPVADAETHKDPESTGRKRAAMLYPIIKGMACEWRGLKNCGGGRFPIVGCIDGKQVHRHHGPIKRTVVNKPGNVHLICPTCHRRWHAANDKHYSEEEYAKLPHNPEPADPLELVLTKQEEIPND